MKKYLAISEFRRLGYLQEVNRQILHPLGLALEVSIEDSGEEKLSGIWDCRDEDEGVIFNSINQDKIDYVTQQLVSRRQARMNAVGFVIQDLGQELFMNKKVVIKDELDAAAFYEPEAGVLPEHYVIPEGVRSLEEIEQDEKNESK